MKVATPPAIISGNSLSFLDRIFGDFIDLSLDRAGIPDISRSIIRC